MAPGRQRRPRGLGRRRRYQGLPGTEALPRARLEELLERAARAEGELVARDALLATKEELVATLTATLAHERARADRLEAALVEARRPWLARVLDGLRRRGG